MKGGGVAPSPSPKVHIDEARQISRNGSMADRVNVLGVGVNVLNLELAAATIEGWLRDGRREYVCVTGVHGVVESRRDPRVRHIHNAAGLVTPDGMPLVWLLRRAGHRDADRVYGPDLMLLLLERSVLHGLTHFLYGATDATLAELRRRLVARFSGLRISGAFAPPFRPPTAAEDDATVAMINRAAPDFLWVGLSTPKQEIWMAEHRARLDAGVLIGVGAAFDFHAGRVRQAPKWVQRHGLEWLFRLCREPRRLWRRYLYGNTRFLLEIVAQQTGLRRYSADP
jgi:N-acetylglucosaminyldiphosphoundecaprenol N-acetyl-beta-D-mannosaminyltransferase